VSRRALLSTNVIPTEEFRPALRHFACTNESARMIISTRCCCLPTGSAVAASGADAQAVQQQLDRTGQAALVGQGTTLTLKYIASEPLLIGPARSS